MSRMKSSFAVLVLTAIVGVVPQAYAAPTITLKVVAAGSSAMWQTMALGAFNNQVSIVSGGGITCHWTSGSNKVNLSDTRPAAGTNNDPGTLWVVWDNNTTGTLVPVTVRAPTLLLTYGRTSRLTPSSESAATLLNPTATSMVPMPISRLPARTRSPRRCLAAARSQTVRCRSLSRLSSRTEL